MLNPPQSFDSELAIMSGVTKVIKSEAEIPEIEFALVFVTKQHQIDGIISRIYPKLKGDTILRFCYPKGTSKKYACDFNRDNGWSTLRTLKLEPVRQVAIDEDWSALRFRKVEFIKTMTRKEENFNKGDNGK